ncbi:MAG: SWF/SNF helicase family protein, partial [Ketobacter sp.]|nr:SWF/SNF helicase family protein [Ketobacter sp.]
EQRGQQQILLLTALLKLRQICCDPGLLGAPDIGSAKREHCIEMIEELVEEKRAILVFSQFTSMLERLAHDLDERNINYLKLTGKSRNRQQLVESFQDGAAPVFLISLKAGGVGLNLTRADTVIHFDPWWNLAAEQQASDRVHRIGQLKPVFIYKLIATNTIEEKIATLQQQKANFSNHINHQAQISGNQFSMKLEDLMSLWQVETKNA